MLTPRSFKNPKNWSELSIQEILENVRYLQKYYGLYKIKKIDNKTIKIGNVLIYKDFVENQQNRTYFITIKGVTICVNKYPQIYNELDRLYCDCDKAIKPFKEKVKNKAVDWWQSNRDVVIIATEVLGLVAISVLMLYMLAQKEQKKMQQEQEKKEQKIQQLQDRIKKSLAPSKSTNQGTTLYLNELLKQHVR